MPLNPITLHPLGGPLWCGAGLSSGLVGDMGWGSQPTERVHTHPYLHIQPCICRQLWRDGAVCFLVSVESVVHLQRFVVELLAVGGVS